MPPTRRELPIGRDRGRVAGGRYCREILASLPAPDPNKESVLKRSIDVDDLILEVETAWIPLADGRRLAARLFLPRTADTTPAPVILEYIPYRRRDGTRIGDEGMHRWFAARGYACVRVDIAGSGDSDGLLDDEYVQREQDDGLEVIAWLAAQPWSSGSVGMIGISWGGFNGLQIAARRPPALRAIITVCSTVDRYHGDVHFTGGCLNEENLEWGGCLYTMHGYPPDPDIVGRDRWREMWRDRLEHAPLPPAEWLAHQRRDEFWKHGSVIEDLTALQVPVLAVSGWVDGYTGVVFDLVEGLSRTPGAPPCKGIVGPWGHKYPQDGIPGPAIGFLQEASRWWDRWLLEDETGVEQDPPMRLWLQTSHPTLSHIGERPGQWIGFDEWPTAGRLRLRLDGDDLRPVEPGGDPHSGSRTNGAARTICSPVTTGLAAGQWCAYGQGKIAPELALDQRTDDIGSLCSDSVPLDEPVELIGRPVVHLRVTSDRPQAMVAVRLVDVHPDGTSERLGYGVLNLTHHAGHETPEALVPGRHYDVSVVLTPLAHTVPAGHRIRVAISTSYWPMIWPSPELATLTVYEAGTVIDLPVPGTGVRTTTPIRFEPPEDAHAGQVTSNRTGVERRTVVRDLGLGSTTFSAWRDDGENTIDAIGTTLAYTRLRQSSITDGDPLSARSITESRATFRRDDWNVTVETRIELTCDADQFRFVAHMTALDDNEPFFERQVDRSIRRDHL